jgi:hypothetical protein
MTEKYKDKRVGYIDFYHGKRRSEGVVSAPIFEGRIKLTENMRKGEEIKIAVWEKVKEGVTKDEMFSGNLTISISVE